MKLFRNFFVGLFLLAALPIYAVCFVAFILGKGFFEWVGNE